MKIKVMKSHKYSDLKRDTTLEYFMGRIDKLFPNNRNIPIFQTLRARVRRIQKRYIISSIKEHRTFAERTERLYSGLKPFIQMSNAELLESGIEKIKISKGGTVKISPNRLDKY